VLDDFKSLSIGNQGDPIRYSRNPVPKVRLLGHHINHFRLGMLAQTIATSQHGHENDAYCGAKEETEAGTAVERQSCKHMRVEVSLSPLDRISYCDAHRVHRRAAFPDKKLLSLSENETARSHPH
jgi:hypothetical protein